MKRCPHASPPVLYCWRCTARMVDPPVLAPPRRKPERHRPRGYRITLPDGRTWTFEHVSRATAARAACRLAGRRRLPRGTRWEAL